MTVWGLFSCSLYKRRILHVWWRCHPYYNSARSLSAEASPNYRPYSWYGRAHPPPSPRQVIRHKSTWHTISGISFLRWNHTLPCVYPNTTTINHKHPSHHYVTLHNIASLYCCTGNVNRIMLLHEHISSLPKKGRIARTIVKYLYSTLFEVIDT